MAAMSVEANVLTLGVRHDGGCRDARGPVGRARGRAPLALVHGEVVDVWHWMLYNYVIKYYKSLELPL